jgi:hypothetical protein
MFGQFAELPVPGDGAVVEGAVVDGVVVVEGVVAVVVVPEDVPMAALATATTPPPSAPVHASVASNFRVPGPMIYLLSRSVD